MWSVSNQTPSRFAWGGSLAHFGNTEKTGVETPRRIFTSSRHGKLDVMDSDDRAFVHK
jgi:hypothetical protein